MLFGLIRSGTFALSAGLVFLLSQQAPRLGSWEAQPQSSALVQTRNDILAGLVRVRADLETNGNLLTRTRLSGQHPSRIAPDRLITV
jgi:hypothetical protein